MFSKDEVIKIFYKADDFCKEFESEIIQIKQLSLPSDKQRRNRQGFMSCSEILTILICFHLGAHKIFKDYYLQIVRNYWSDLFPKTLSYNRFIEIQHRYFFILALFVKEKCLGKCTGISFVDSTTLKVCKNQRIIGHKTFKNIAERGKSSIGVPISFVFVQPPFTCRSFSLPDLFPQARLQKRVVTVFASKGFLQYSQIFGIFSLLIPISFTSFTLSPIKYD